MKRVGILGSTGSIGQCALQVVQHLRDHFSITALAAKSDIDLLEIQAKEFSPEVIGVWDKDKAQILQKRLPTIPVLGGPKGVIEAAIHSSTELVFSAISGFEGILPLLRAIEARKEIALANKEALVAGGSFLTDLASAHNVTLIPVDSEHTAIFQCLKGENLQTARRVILTASGGPFYGYSEEKLAQIGLKDALVHPHYKMGSRGSVNSSTLMNKGFEMIEARYFYGLAVDVLIHPEQIIHSMVEFIDGSIMAQMNEPDMRIPIQVALTHPERREGMLKPFDFSKERTLSFSPYKKKTFRCLDLAYESVEIGKSMPCFMNAANDVLVNRFLNSEISWIDIGQKLEDLMQRHTPQTPKGYEELANVDLEARQLAQRI